MKCIPGLLDLRFRIVYNHIIYQIVNPESPQNKKNKNIIRFGPSTPPHPDQDVIDFLNEN